MVSTVATAVPFILCFLPYDVSFPSSAAIEPPCILKRCPVAMAGLSYGMLHLMECLVLWNASFCGMPHFVEYLT